LVGNDELLVLDLALGVEIGVEVGRGHGRDWGQRSCTLASLNRNVHGVREREREREREDRAKLIYGWFKEGLKMTSEDEMKN
jgi:hypothetical protein